MKNAQKKLSEAMHNSNEGLERLCRKGVFISMPIHAKLMRWFCKLFGWEKSSLNLFIKYAKVK